MSLSAIKGKKLIVVAAISIFSGLVISLVSIANETNTTMATEKMEPKKVDTERFCYYKNLAYSEGAEIGVEDGTSLLCKRKMIWSEN
ncbi:YnjH family protein [Porticoccaceae bacterium]|nr:YnjH family protein [Porticoccaceae bacterium]MDA8652400.1 YnjH family protein [Porticoccaceae bacterium]MDA8681304.1 YnjH family protein [Porticoccaceae bacterium]